MFFAALLLLLLGFPVALTFGGIALIFGVLAEGWDPGWRAGVDRAPARVLRVNGDRLGVVLEEGAHRVVFHHHARGLGAGLALALLAAASLALSLVRETLTARRRRQAGEV